MALKSKSGKTKDFQVEEESEGSEEDSDEDELSMISRRISQIWKHRQSKFRGSRRTNGRSESTSGQKKASGKEVTCYECKEPKHYKNECSKLRKDKKPEEVFKENKGLMETWDDSKSEEEDSDE